MKDKTKDIINSIFTKTMFSISLLTLIFLFCLNLCPMVLVGAFHLVGSGISGEGGTCSTSNDSVLISQETTDANYYVNSLSWKAQQFQHDADITITQIDLYISETAGAGNGILSLRADSLDLPTGEDIANTTINVSHTSIGATDGWVSFVFATPYEYTANTKLHIIFRSDQIGTQDYFINVEHSNAYADGGYAYSTYGGTGWTALANYDVVFRIYGCE